MKRSILLPLTILFALFATSLPARAASRLVRVGLSTHGAPIRIWSAAPLHLSDPTDASHILTAPAATTISVFGAADKKAGIAGNPAQVESAARPIAVGWGGPLSGWKTLLVSSASLLRISSDGSEARFAPRAYRGTLEITPQTYSFEPSEHKGPLRLVNILPLDDYLLGVVPWEMDADAPLEALKAQAICARSESLAKIRGGRHARDGFDICDYDHCQGYRGTENEAPASTLAVRQTAGLVLWSEGRIADAVYGTNSGGITAGAGDVWRGAPEPYLQSVADCSPAKHPALAALVKKRLSEADWTNFCTHPLQSYAAPSASQIRSLAARRRRSASTAALFGPDDLPEFYRWTRLISPSELAKVLWSRQPNHAGTSNRGAAWTTISEIRIIKRAASGHIQKLLCIARGQNGAAIPVAFEGDSQIRGMLSGRLGSTTALPSSTFVVVPRRSAKGVLTAFVLKGAGWGHGVGMCQRGAQAHARDGWSARQILMFYFHGVQLAKVA